MGDYLEGVEANQRRTVRFLSLEHWYNDHDASAHDLELAAQAVREVVARLSRGERRAGWWDDLVRAYPCGLSRDRLPRDQHVNDLAREVYQMTGTELPCLHADWLVSTVCAGYAEPASEAIRLVQARRGQALSLRRAAWELGLPGTGELSQAIRASEVLRERGLGALLQGGTVPREAWESVRGSISCYQEAAREVGLGVPCRAL
jgi:hypothetical protein